MTESMKTEEASLEDQAKVNEKINHINESLRQTGELLKKAEKLKYCKTEYNFNLII